MFHVDRVVVIPFGPRDALANMDLDQRLLDRCEQAPRKAYLRFYTWVPPALSLGRFEPADAVDAARARARGVEVVRRPTGGRVVLHADDLTYAVVAPREAGATVGDAYAWISGRIVEGLRRLGADVEAARGSAERSVARRKPCFLSAARHEIVHAGRKLVGSAQRLGRNALLQHGSIPVGRGYREVVDYLAADEMARQRLAEEMLSGTVCLEEVLGRRPAEAEVAAVLEGAFAEGFGAPVERPVQLSELLP
jgi:lipoate-protein ligase A